MKKIIIGFVSAIVIILLAFYILLEFSGGCYMSKGERVVEKLESGDDSDKGAVEVLKENMDVYNEIYGEKGTYLRRYVTSDALFSYWQSKKLRDYTYIVEFGHKYIDTDTILYRSFLIDTRLNSFIEITRNGIYADEVRTAIADSFVDSIEGGDESDAIEIAQKNHSGFNPTINDGFFHATAGREKTRQLYWRANRLRAHTFVVYLTSIPQKYKNVKEYVCGIKAVECDHKGKIVPGRYFYVNTKLGQSIEITNNKNFKHLIAADKLFPDDFTEKP